MGLFYLDSSALVELLGPDDRVAPLADLLRGHRVVASDLARVEVTRAAARIGLEPARAQLLLRDVSLVRIEVATLTLAMSVAPPALGSLDAIHLATAIALAGELDGVVTYDRQLGSAARRAGLRVFAPRPAPS